MRVRQSWQLPQDPPKPLGGGVAVPSRFTADATGDDLPYDVHVVVVLDDGRLVCAELTAARKPGGRAVTSDGIRRIPVAGIIRAAASALVMTYGPTEQPGVTRIEPYSAPSDVTEHGPTDAALQAVTVIYRLAYAVGDPPVKAVMESLDLPRSTAGRWVALARERGLLGETTPGRAAAGGSTVKGD